MLWFASREKLPHEEAQEQYDQRPSTYVKVYDISGFNYCVYRISTPDEEAYETHEGQDDPYFIAEKSDDPMSTILQTAAGYATYQTLDEAKNALDTMYEAMNPAEDDPNAPVSGSTTVQGGTRYESTESGGSKAEKADLSKEQEKTFVAEGLEEGATLEELDVQIYDGSGEVVDSYSVETQTVQTGNTDLTGAI